MTMTTEGKLMVVDDDAVLREKLGRALSNRGFDVLLAEDPNQAMQVCSSHNLDYAVVDMRLGRENGLDLVNKLREHNENMRIVMFTGFGNIASVVKAIKAGAVDYLPKPADADQIVAALKLGKEAALPPPPEQPMPAERVRWEYICRIYEQCNGNISETARRLRMHRRTLQRILQKHAPRENN